MCEGSELLRWISAPCKKKKRKEMGRKFSTVVELQSVFLSAAADFNVSARALPLGARLSSFPVLPTPGKQKGGGRISSFFKWNVCVHV